MQTQVTSLNLINLFHKREHKCVQWIITCQVNCICFPQTKIAEEYLALIVDSGLIQCLGTGLLAKPLWFSWILEDPWAYSLSSQEYLERHLDVISQFMERNVFSSSCTVQITNYTWCQNLTTGVTKPASLKGKKTLNLFPIPVQI